MAKENRDMEKKITSSPARLTSCEPKGKDNGHKTQRYNKGRRGESAQGRNTPDPNNSQSRRPVPQKSRAMDKRPRNRGLPASRRDEVTVGQRAEFGSALPQGPKKINLNHLLNFTFTSREGEESRGGWRGRTRWTHRHPRFNKEQFLQANCQFVVKAGGDYKQQCIDPDTLVDWDMIEQVRMLGHEMPSCPICLFPPAAAKITKCGHIYCWPCILHYLSLGEKKWRKCPICYDSVMANELKSVVAKSLKTFSVGDTITLRLMKREKGSVIIQPHYPDRAPVVTPASPCVTDIPEETCFAKLMVATPSQVKDMILLKEKGELEKQLKESIDEFEKSFVQRALDSLQERDDQLGLSEPSPSNSLVTEKQDCTVPPAGDPAQVDDGLNASSVTTPAERDCIVYESAFLDEEADATDAPPSFPEEGEDQAPDIDSTPPGTQDTRDEDGCDERDGAEDAGTDADRGLEPAGETGAEGKEDGDKDDSKDRQTDTIKEDEKEDTEIPSGPEPSAVQRGRKTSPHQGSNVYFYQAEDGQQLYLGSLNARCLMHEYGGWEHCPLTITAKLVEIEHISITQEMRTRMRHLQHLPLTCEISVCELDLTPPVVSSDTLKFFAHEIQRRRQKRDKKVRDEKRRERKIKQEEDRKNGIYPGPRYSLQSAHQFPSFSGTSASPGYTEVPGAGPPRPISPASVDSGASSNFSAALSDVHDDDLLFADSAPRSLPVDVDPPGAALGGGWPSISSPESQGGHRSFAQMLRDGVAKPGSPMKSGSHTTTPQHHAVTGGYGRPPGRERTSSNDSDNEDYVPVPQYKDAFSNAIQDALDRAAQMSIKKDVEPEGEAQKGSGGGRKKKGRKKQLLFSTAGPRFK